MTKRIAASIMTIAVVLAAVTGATIANFNDTETVPATFSAGTLNLKVGDKDPCEETITVSNIAPGYYLGKEFWFTLKNTGTLTGKLSVDFSDIKNYENGMNEPEAIVDGTGGDPGLGNGELGANLFVEKVHFLTDWNHVVRIVDAGYLNAVGGNTYDAGDNPLGILDPDEEVSFYVRVYVPDEVGNEIQSDSVEFDMIFHLDQE